jgi:uncharacterized membrane protein YcaP (DUF421 family)
MRGLVTYILGIGLTRINKRFIGIRTQFNFILYVMLGSLLATGITGNAPFFPILGMAFVLVFLNWILIKITFFYPQLERLLKGSPEILVKDGIINCKEMKRNSITISDLHSILREQTGTNDINNIETAIFENTGVITIILKK